MMIKDLTLQQFCALDYDRNMVVTSGPGAGKTRILSHRFCFILLTDDTVSLPQILTLTFTEKAAEEMKGRIYEMLSQLDRGLHTKGNGDEGLRERIREARDQFHKNRISTIHSFCASLLREHPVESGVDPSFVIIQGPRKRNIMEQAVEAGVSSVLKNNQDDLFPLLQSFGGRSRLLRAVRNTIEHPLIFKGVMGTSEGLFQTKGWQKQVFREYCRVIKEESLLPYLEGLRRLEKGRGQYEEVLSLLEDWHGNGAQYPDDFGLPNLFRALREMVLNRKPGSPRLSIQKGLREISYLGLVDGFYPDLFSTSSPDDLLEKQLKLYLKIAKVCLENYQSEKEKINGLDFADLEAFSHAFLNDLFQNKDHHGLKRVQRRFKYIMVDEFQDTNRIQWEIISLLCSQKGKNGEQTLQPGKLFVVGDKRQAIYKFRGGDVTAFEYATQKVKQSNQELPVQMFWENPLVNSRLGAMEKGYTESPKKWTEAFDALSPFEKEKILTGDIYFPQNFRTDGRPIKFLNTAFGQIFSNKGAETLREYETAPMPITVPDKTGLLPENGSVTFYLTHASSQVKDQSEREASLIVEIIESLLGRHGKETFEYKNYTDIREKIENNQLAIGILFFAFTHLKTFETIFREAGLPFKVHRGKGFYRCQEVMEMIQLLNYLSDERQHISLLAVIRSPIFALKDAQIFDLFYGNKPGLEQFLSSEGPHVKAVGRQIQSWRFLSGRLPLAELIRSIMADRGLRAIYSVHPNGVQRLANMEKLIEIARRFQAEGNGSLPEFVQYCLGMAEEEDEEGEALILSEGESPICLMTIHAAKGLEFPMVIIPNLDRRPPMGTESGKPVRLYSSERTKPGDWNLPAGEIPVWQVEVPELDFRKTYGPLGYLLARRNRLEDMAENRRVFYVGCTRTRNHLILIGHMGNRLLEKEKASLSTEDYRERATIMDLLDDIYQFKRNFPPDHSTIHKGEEGLPTIIWKEPEPRTFRGFPDGGKKLGREDFGIYDDEIKALDLTGPIDSPPYHQFSFKSIRIFKQCPVMFYYSVILGLKMNGLSVWRPSVEGEGPVGGPERDNDWDYGSREALFVGNITHGYLERHAFGEAFDENRFNTVFGKLIQPDQFGGLLDPGAITTIREKAVKHLETTVCDERLVNILGGEIEYAEVPFLFTISQGCEFRGTIDRLYKDKGKGHWGILDWKSNDLRGKDPLQVA
ncbi:MAG: UvrD-helicase domain-containing protein, partial [Desulfatiglandales bacterium]